MKSQKWLNRQNRDIFSNKAKNEGYISRSAYKLLEIEKKFKLISKAKKILELGSSPGGWSQVVCNINKTAKIDAFDLLNMKYNNKNIKFYKEDFINYDFVKYDKKYDLILSDMAPNTIGHQSTDHLRIISLIENLINMLKIISNKNSNIVFKIWKGSEEKKIVNALKKNYSKVSYYKPNSSRKESAEIYIIAENFLQ